MNNNKDKSKRKKSFKSKLHSGILILPESHKVLIRQTWCHLQKDATNTGALVFLRIFEMDPKVKQQFPFREYSGEELRKNSLFKHHVTR